MPISALFTSISILFSIPSTLLWSQGSLVEFKSFPLLHRSFVINSNWINNPLGPGEQEHQREKKLILLFLAATMAKVMSTRRVYTARLHSQCTQDTTEFVSFLWTGAILERADWWDKDNAVSTFPSKGDSNVSIMCLSKENEGSLSSEGASHRSGQSVSEGW